MSDYAKVTSQHLIWGQVLRRHWHWLSSPNQHLKRNGDKHSQSTGVLSVTRYMCRPLWPLSLWARGGFLLPSRLFSSQWVSAFWDVPSMHTSVQQGCNPQGAFSLCVTTRVEHLEETWNGSWSLWFTGISKYAEILDGHVLSSDFLVKMLVNFLSEALSQQRST